MCVKIEELSEEDRAIIRSFGADAADTAFEEPRNRLWDVREEMIRGFDRRAELLLGSA